MKILEFEGDEEQDTSSYWIILRKHEDTGN
jgi:hypothetical protein